MDPRDERQLEQASGYLELDLPDEAVTLLERCAESTRELFEWNLMMGEAHRQAARYAQALPYLERAKSRRRDVLDVYVALGWCFKRVGKLSSAIEALQEAIGHSHSADNQQRALIMYNLSCYYALADEKPEMLRWLSMALNADKNKVLRRLIEEETDFDAFRDDDDFVALVAGSSEN